MERLLRYALQSVILALFALLIMANKPYVMPASPLAQQPDTTRLRFPIPADDGNPYNQIGNQSPLYLRDPDNIRREVVYDPISGQYIFYNRIGDFQYRTPTSMSQEEFMEYQNRKGIQQYWQDRSRTSTPQTAQSIIPPIHIGGQAFDRIFGGSTIDIRPQGSAEITFGVRSNLREDPQLDVRRRRTTNFDFDQRIQMNVIAKIGDKIEFRTNYNTQATFQFENRLALKYEGKEDEIIKLIEAGNVSFPLSTTLINGSQALFGIKTKMQFGRTTVTAVFSQQESETRNITVQGGAQTNQFKLSSLDYEENRHFFISHHFREQYENALKSLPIVGSDINITKVEVWLTNIGAAVEDNRNIIALTDLGEGRREWIGNREVSPRQGPPLPTNRSNNMMSRMDTTSLRSINTVSAYLTGDPLGIGRNGYMVAGQDFEKIENARKLSPSEYTFNSKLGFISLNTTLNADQTLAVAYQYTVIGYDSVFQVGEFSDQGINAPRNLIVKLLKSSAVNTRLPMWNLMMKNVYSIRAFQVNREDFTLNILYSGNDNAVLTGYFTEGPENVKGIPLIHLMAVDNLNQQMNPVAGGDGVFDFIDNAATQGGTINSANGRIYFPVLEPFGSHVRKKIFPDNPDLADRYAFDSLYTQTKTGAEQYPEKNKFFLEGYYKSQSGSEINLNALNVPQGSVRVTAGGVPLTENVDYTVDYTLGRVRIINEGILSSGTPINISLESNQMFAIQQKRMMGLRVDHEINRDFRLGATLLNLHERPLTQKVNYGDDPISNTIYGLDLSYRRESRWLTNMLNKIPGISTNQISRINIDTEFAHFLPGHSRAVGKSGTSYIDDFEGAKSKIDLRQQHTWFLASTPQGQTDIFPEAAPGTGLGYGKNRAKLAWYIIDPLFYDRFGTLRPPNVDRNELSKHSVRQVLETEVFPNKDIPSGLPTNIAVLNMAYYPEERGPYNYDVNPTSYTAGLTEDGLLAQPESRWGGIMRRIESTDFEATNIEYLEFWMMDPFTDDPTNTGELYINLGDVSEDILRDGRKFFEHGLPVSEEVINVDTTIWGRVPTLQALTESFSNLPGSRQFQDVGYDGLRDEDERTFHSNFLDNIRSRFGENSRAFQLAWEDPSADNYQYFRGSALDTDSRYSSILERYKDFNGPDGNSPTDDMNPENYPTSATMMPNMEDINRDNTLSEAERYFQYRIVLDPSRMKVGENYIADIHEAKGIPLQNGEVGEVTWYQFKVPVNQPDKVVGSIEDFRSIRFIRMFFRGFERPVVARFATLELVRGEWRRYRHNLEGPGEYIINDDANETLFDISAVNIEENGRRDPIPYVIPPGIEREINYGTTSLVRLNEQSMAFTVHNLQDGDARAAYKTTSFDFRQYKRLKMYVHAEKLIESQELDYGDLTVFIRMGADFTQNYYEYEIPLTFTPWYTPFTDVETIWPEANNFDIELEELVEVKHRRNIAMRDPNSTVNWNYPYVENIGDHIVKVVGNPSISDVKGIMIGVRNPKRVGINSKDDGQPKSAILWVNELRVTDFNNRGGWAATARIETHLADLGRVVVSGAHSTAGFGSLDMKVNEVPLETATDFTVATDLDLGKFLPESTGVRIPMHFDYGETHIRPEYNPLNPDIRLRDELNSFDTKAEQDSIRVLVNDYTQRKNLNFMNVRKDRVGRGTRQPRFYDIENLNVSYSYSEIYRRNIDVEYDMRKQYRGGMGYNFMANPKNVTPFARASWAQKPFMQLIKDFNFYYMPKNFAFRTEMNRQHNEKKFRNKSEGDIITYPIFSKQWNWNRNYDLKFDLTRSLTMDFTAGANAYIYEPAGNPERDSEAWLMNRDTIRSEIMRLGSKDRYNQSVRLNYNVPINKIPLFNWITATAGYQAMYSWTASPISVQDRIGNVIENQNTKQLNTNIDFVRLYSKNNYLKNLVQPPRSAQRGGPGGQRPGAGPPQRPARETQAEPDTLQEKERVNYAKIIADNVLKLAMSARRGSISYTQNNGMLLPGFMPEPDLLGMSFVNQAPGWGFIFGDETDIRQKAAMNGWITTDSLLNQAFAKRHTENLNYRLNLEPIPGLRIDISGDKTTAFNFQEYFRADSMGVFQSFSPVESGNFSMSYGLWGTSFVRARDDESSQLFDDLIESRQIIAERLAYDNRQWVEQGERFIYDSVGQGFYPFGYTSVSQDVLIYSFLAAYRGVDAGSIKLNPFPTIPIPNWSVNYNGLTRIPAIGRLFRTVTLTHSYRSAYSINSWRTNVDYDPKNTTRTFANTDVFISRYDISQIAITEQYAPLIGIDMAMQNSLTTRVEYKKNRNLTMSFVNNQLTEVVGQEIILGFGYRIRNLAMAIANLTGGMRISRSTSDLVMKLDLGFRNDKTTLRRIDERNSQVSAGQNRINFYFTADYMLNDRFNLQAFYKHDLTDPFVSNQFRNSMTHAGITMRFNLAQ